MTAEETKNATPAGALMVESYFPTFIFYKDFPDGDELNATLKPRIYAWRTQDEES